MQNISTFQHTTVHWVHFDLISLHLAEIILSREVVRGNTKLKVTAVTFSNSVSHDVEEKEQKSHYIFSSDQSPPLKSIAEKYDWVSTSVPTKQKLTWVPFKATNDSWCAITFSPWDWQSHWLCLFRYALWVDIPKLCSRKKSPHEMLVWMKPGHFADLTAAFQLTLQFPRAAPISWPAVVRKHVGTLLHTNLCCSGFKFPVSWWKQSIRFNLTYHLITNTSTAVVVKVVPYAFLYNKPLFKSTNIYFIDYMGLRGDTYLAYGITLNIKQSIKLNPIPSFDLFYHLGEFNVTRCSSLVIYLRYTHQTHLWIPISEGMCLVKPNILEILTKKECIC